jgi:hypothetical protein
MKNRYRFDELMADSFTNLRKLIKEANINHKEHVEISMRKASKQIYLRFENKNYSFDIVIFQRELEQFLNSEYTK